MDLITSPSFKSHIEALLEKHRIPGLSLAVVHNDDFRTASFGKARLAVNSNASNPASESSASNEDQPCTADTLFDIASCSKSFTAAAVGMLVEDDENFPQVKWDSKMSDLLPEDFVLADDEYTRGVTLEDCLSHRTGLPNHDASYYGLSSATPDTPKSITRNLRNLPLAKSIRSAYIYNNMLFTVATHLIETLTGQTFAHFLQERIFNPLKMTSSFLQPSAVHAVGQAERMACGYRFGPAHHTPIATPPNLETPPEQETYHPLPSPTTPEAQGAGSLLLSAHDHMTYLHALLHSLPPFSPTLLPSLTTPRFALPSPSAPQPQTSSVLIGLGWEIIYYRGTKIVYHDGWINGFVSTQFLLPERGFAGCVRCNGEGDGGFVVVQRVFRELVDEVLGVVEGERTDWGEWFERFVIKEEEGRETREDVVRALRGEEEELVGGVGKIDIASSPAASSSAPGNAPGVAHGEERPPPPPEIFQGAYYSSGYRTFTIQLSQQPKAPEQQILFIDASDRSFGLTITLKFICWAPPPPPPPPATTISSGEEEAQQTAVQQTKGQSGTQTARFLATLTDNGGCVTEFLEAEFVLEEVGEDRDEAEGGRWRAVRFGVKLEEVLEEMIWFERVDGIN